MVPGVWSVSGPGSVLSPDSVLGPESAWRRTKDSVQRTDQGRRTKHQGPTRGELMFIGHFGLGFGAKKAAPAVSLGSLFAACQFADLLWPTLVLLGVEQVEVQPGATRM